MVPSSETAEAPVEIPEDLTPQEVRDLIARLSDEEVREIVIKQLDKVAIDGENQRYTTEPNTGFWRRFGVGFLRMLPIESLL